jgi:hypothetical protein
MTKTAAAMAAIAFLGNERSALVDRIARARGHDVLVVLRRKTPPYDQIVVRGYASQP